MSQPPSHLHISLVPALTTTRDDTSWPPWTVTGWMDGCPCRYPLRMHLVCGSHTSLLITS